MKGKLASNRMSTHVFYYQPLSSRTAPKMSVIFRYYKIMQKSGSVNQLSCAY